MTSAHAQRKTAKEIFARIEIGDVVRLKALPGHLYGTVWGDTRNLTIKVSFKGSNYIIDPLGQKFSYTEVESIVSK